MMILPVGICMPHAKVMMQMLQTENDREVVDEVKDEDSRKVKSADADLMSQIPKPKLVACSTDGNDITHVSQTTKASKVLKKYKVAIPEECPTCGKYFRANSVLR